MGEWERSEGPNLGQQAAISRQTSLGPSLGCDASHLLPAQAPEASVKTTSSASTSIDCSGEAVSASTASCSEAWLQASSRRALQGGQAQQEEVGMGLLA